MNGRLNGGARKQRLEWRLAGWVDFKMGET